MNSISNSPYILETKALTKSFGEFRAVKGVDLKVRRGSIHALIGPNGAGKTTTFNLITKFLSPSSGKIFFNGEDITNARPADIARRGMVRSFQISAVFPHMSSRENVIVALQQPTRKSFQFWRPETDLDVFTDRADELLAAVGLLPFAHTPVSEMAYGQRRALEIATTLALEPEMLLLDEPTSGLGQEDVERIAQLIRKNAEKQTILLVEHNLSVVSTLCDRISVLTRGSILAEGNYEEVSKNPDVIQAYMGNGYV